MQTKYDLQAVLCSQGRLSCVFRGTLRHSGYRQLFVSRLRVVLFSLKLLPNHVPCNIKYIRGVQLQHSLASLKTTNHL